MRHSLQLALAAAVLFHTACSSSAPTTNSEFKLPPPAASVSQAVERGRAMCSEELERQYQKDIPEARRQAFTKRKCDAFALFEEVTPAMLKIAPNIREDVDVKAALGFHMRIMELIFQGKIDEAEKVLPEYEASIQRMAQRTKQ